jgi:hypothetical protein
MAVMAMNCILGKFEQRGGRGKKINKSKNQFALPTDCYKNKISKMRSSAVDTHLHRQLD